MDTDDIIERAKRFRSEALRAPSSSPTPSAAGAILSVRGKEGDEDGCIEAALAIAARGNAGASVPPIGAGALPEDAVLQQALATQQRALPDDRDDLVERAISFAASSPFRFREVDPSSLAPATPPVLVFRGDDGRLRVSGGHATSSSQGHSAPPDSLPPRPPAARSRSRPPPVSDREAAAMAPILDAADVAAADDAQAKELEVARLLALMSDELLARAVSMPESEIIAIARVRSHSQDETRLRIVGVAFRKSSPRLHPPTASWRWRCP